MSSIIPPFPCSTLSESLSRAQIQKPTSKPSVKNDSNSSNKKIAFLIRSPRFNYPASFLLYTHGIPIVRTNSKTHLETLRKKQLELVKQIKEAEAKTKKDQQEKDERRKLVAGAVALKEFEANPSGEFATALLGLLNHGVAKSSDRALFNLPALPKEPKPAPEATPAPFLMASGGSEVGNG